MVDAVDFLIEAGVLQAKESLGVNRNGWDVCPVACDVCELRKK